MIVADFGIREHLAGFVTGTMSIDEFRSWFVNSYFLIDVEGDDEATEAIGEIENRLAELSSGYIREDQIRAALQPLAARLGATNGPIGLADSRGPRTSGSTAQVIDRRSTAPQPASPAGRRLQSDLPMHVIRWGPHPARQAVAAGRRSAGASGTSLVR